MVVPEAGFQHISQGLPIKMAFKQIPTEAHLTWHLMLIQTLAFTFVLRVMVAVLYMEVEIKKFESSKL